MTPENQGYERLDDRVGEIQAALLRVLRSLVFRDEPGVDYGELPVSQLRCLHIIADGEGQKMNDLSHRMEVKLPAASQIVDRLVKRGMVERHNDPNDRRVVRVELTQAARAMVDTLRERRDSRMRSTLGNLNRDEVEQVIAGLRLLGVAAEAHVASERAGQTDENGDKSASDLVAFPRRLSRASIEGSTPVVSPNS